LRITAGDILGWLSADMTVTEIIDNFPDLTAQDMTAQDIQAALAFAAERERRSAFIEAA
jgi:uncharacterized protein (DUF433 family)